MAMTPSTRSRLIRGGVFLAVILVIAFIYWMRATPHDAPRVVTAPPPAIQAPSPTPVKTPSSVKPVTPPALPKPTPKVPQPRARAPVATKPSPLPSPTPAPYHPPVPLYVPPPPPPEAQAWQGIDTSVKHEGQIVVRSEEAWIHFWTEHHPDEAAPDVDFTRNMVVGIFVGSRPAEQFSVSIVDVKAQPSGTTVDYRERYPPTGTFAVGVSVFPYALKVVPRSPNPVKFTKLEPERP
jgi:hypothetical protein